MCYAVGKRIEKRNEGGPFSPQPTKLNGVIEVWGVIVLITTVLKAGTTHFNLSLRMDKLHKGVILELKLINCSLLFYAGFPIPRSLLHPLFSPTHPFLPFCNSLEYVSIRNQGMEQSQRKLQASVRPKFICTRPCLMFGHLGDCIVDTPTPGRCTALEVELQCYLLRREKQLHCVNGVLFISVSHLFTLMNNLFITITLKQALIHGAAGVGTCDMKEFELI